MHHHSLRLAFAVASTLVLAGCAPDSGDDSAADREAFTGETGAAANVHLAAVGKCNKAHNKQAAKAVSTNDVLQAEAAWQTCLESAATKAVAVLEKNLTDAGSSLTATAAKAISGFRAAQRALCEELDKASPNFGGSLARVESVACLAESEAFLASVLDTYAAFGDSAGSIPEDRPHHRSCYRVYDKRFEAATSTNAMIQAEVLLGTCVAKRATLLAPEIAKVEIANDAAAGPADAAQKRIRAVAEALRSSGEPLCQMVNEAGDNGTGSLSRVIGASCSGHVAEAAYKMMRVVVDQ